MEVKNTKFGRGVFAENTFKVGDIIEVSPVVVLNTADTKKIEKTMLYDYYYSWGSDSTQAAIALGFGSLFNHSYEPNAEYVKDIINNVIKFIAIKPIKKGEEVFINYNGNPSGRSPLWFDVKKSD